MKEMCLLWLTFFGRTYDFIELSAEYINHVYEKFFYMKNYMNWSFEEIYMLPVNLREWFFNKWLEVNSAKKDES
jgi:hypothetical protein